MNKETKKRWCPYIKQTKRKHESGFRCFEIGYIADDLTTKVVIGKYSDHVWSYSIKPRTMDLNMDIMPGGEIRLHSFEGVKWRYAGSSAILESGWPDEEEINKYLTTQDE